MTRFARAKGSKSSNERAPEDSTPWEVMKEQLLQAKKESEESLNRKEAEKQRIENYENFLKEHKVQKRKATWCDFPETVNKRLETNTLETNGPPVKSKKKNKKQVADGPEQSEPTDNALETNGPVKSKKKNKKNFANNLEQAEPTDNTLEVNVPPVKSKKKNKNKVANCPDQSETNNHEGNLQNHVSDNSVGIGKKPKKMKKKSQITTEPQSESNSLDVTETIQSNKKKNKNKKKPAEPSSTVPNNNENSTTEDNKNNNSIVQPMNDEAKGKNKKNKKFKDGKPVRRKEINDRSFQLIVNGKEIELVRFDGFPVMRKDADRLQDLKNNMIKKGIPKSEVQRTMKLERRRAEKALARMKREVCYNCRKGGHVLSDCPELKSKIPGADVAEGVCFKCGSTEHRQFECKVQRDKEFRFATCFICKEPGHIARQCPDNPKGLYPNGGSCKLCGDVTHLRKDCPTVMDKKEETTVKLHTLTSYENIEDVGQQNNKFTPTETSKKPKKIKF